MTSFLEEPVSIRNMLERNARHGEKLFPDHSGYEEALRRVDNRSGTGTLYDDLGGEGIQCDRSIIMVKGTYHQGPYDQLQADSTLHIGSEFGGLDVVTFPPDSKVAERIIQLRGLIPPTVAVPLAKDAGRDVRNDIIRTRVQNSKVKGFITNVLRLPVTTGDLDKDNTEDLGISGTYAPAERIEKATREFVRNVVAKTRGLNPDQISLSYGADEALTMILAAQTRQGQKPQDVAVSGHEYRRFLESSGALFNCRLFGLNPCYGDINKTELRKGANIVYFSTPNNPTGISLTVEEIRQLIGKTEPRTTVIVDITGLDADSKTGTPAEIVGMSSEIQDRTVFVIDSLSKKEMSPWLRIGWLTCNDPSVLSGLRTVEARCSPVVGRVFHNRMTWLDTNNVKRDMAKYLLKFHIVARALELSSTDAFRIFRSPHAVNAGRYPSGCYFVVEFDTIPRRDQYLQRLSQIGQNEFNVPIVAPFIGNDTRNRFPRSVHLPSSQVATRGLPFMSDKCVRLCATGPAFQLDALAEACGIS